MRARYYTEHHSEIAELRAKAQSAPSVNERLAALETLTISFPDAAPLEAAELVGDKVTAVAKQAAEILASSIVMSDHVHGDARSPYHEFVLVSHERARRALLSIIQDPRVELRSIAASILASLSDEDALQKIDAAAKAGIYSQVEAVNYFGVSKPSVGAQYLERYLEIGSAEARAGAVQYLGANSRYQAKIRDTVLFNPEEVVSVRTAAAKTLGRYDAGFSSYALSLALNQKTPPQLYLEVWQTYLSADGPLKSLDMEHQKALRRSLERFVVENPQINVKALRDRLNQMQHDLNKN
jgi:HEAT repeat protein